ncbi:hypothetical protein AVEN_234337-1 [Araneus ventricosus]|uniref:Uncharacterized protein n=1 Tax=Araneus ventricosus TaxID=182803 RepID=A0A4Y2AAQ4_ARAVE|nr:hypothetical protein AVEN_234337-1 [Araneus ventricosus]
MAQPKKSLSKTSPSFSLVNRIIKMECQVDKTVDHLFYALILVVKAVETAHETADVYGEDAKFLVSRLLCP